MATGRATELGDRIEQTSGGELALRFAYGSVQNQARASLSPILTFQPLLAAELDKTQSGEMMY